MCICCVYTVYIKLTPPFADRFLQNHGLSILEQIDESLKVQQCGDDLQGEHSFKSPWTLGFCLGPGEDWGIGMHVCVYACQISWNITLIYFNQVDQAIVDYTTCFTVFFPDHFSNSITESRSVGFFH